MAISIFRDAKSFFSSIYSQSKVGGFEHYNSAMLVAGLGISNKETFYKYAQWYGSWMMPRQAQAGYEVFSYLYNVLGLRNREGRFVFENVNVDLTQVRLYLEDKVTELELDENDLETAYSYQLKFLQRLLSALISNLRLGDWDDIEFSFNYRMQEAHSSLFAQNLTILIHEATKYAIPSIPPISQES